MYWFSISFKWWIFWYFFFIVTVVWPVTNFSLFTVGHILVFVNWHMPIVYGFVIFTRYDRGWLLLATCQVANILYTWRKKLKF